MAAPTAAQRVAARVQEQAERAQRVAPPRHTRLCGCCDGWHRVRPKWVCLACRRVDCSHPCCRAHSVRLGYHVRVPRRHASRKTWQRFLVRFAGVAAARRARALETSPSRWAAPTADAATR